MTYYVTIGNSDNKLTQVNWAMFQGSLLRTIQTYANEIRGTWYSLPVVPFRNMCIGFEVYESDRLDKIKSELRILAEQYDQDSIALATAETELVKPRTS